MAQTLPSTKPRTALTRFLQHESATTIAGLVVFALVFLFFAWRAPGFLTRISLVGNILVPASIGATIALGMTMVMAGSPRPISTSTSMSAASSPTTAHEATLASIDYLDGDDESKGMLAETEVSDAHIIPCEMYEI